MRSGQTGHGPNVVVAFDKNSDQPYTLYFESDDTWECVSLPDQTVVLQVGSSAAVRMKVTEHMLPGEHDLDRG